MQPAAHIAERKPTPPRSKGFSETRRYLAAQMYELLQYFVISNALSSGTVAGLSMCKGGPTERGGRDCIDKIVNAVNSSSDCRALCCNDSAAHPVPFPGAQPAGCRAWYQNQYNQCFMCTGTRHGGGIPPLQPNKCKPNPERPPCETGVVYPTPGPKPPTPPKSGCDSAHRCRSIWPLCRRGGRNVDACPELRQWE